jgi:exopolyphosphatase/guanosine-5'-triphosphate,3'-diphosphate pyrophosphatase
MLLMGEISAENIDRMCDAMKAFILLAKVHKVRVIRFLQHRLCAEVQWKEVVAIIKKKS